jgi:hypothetical protein
VREVTAGWSCWSFAACWCIIAAYLPLWPYPFWRPAASASSWRCAQLGKGRGVARMTCLIRRRNEVFPGEMPP